MKKEIHPQYSEVTVKCSCGNSFKVGTTAGHDINLEICSECHPFYTGQQKLIDTEKRVDSFMKKFAGFGGKRKAAAQQPITKAQGQPQNPQEVPGQQPNEAPAQPQEMPNEQPNEAPGQPEEQPKQPPEETPPSQDPETKGDE